MRSDWGRIKQYRWNDNLIYAWKGVIAPPVNARWDWVGEHTWGTIKNYKWDAIPIPTILIDASNRGKLSNNPERNKCTITVTCDRNITEWEARLTKVGELIGWGVGTLVASGNTVTVGADITFDIDITQLEQNSVYALNVYIQIDEEEYRAETQVEYDTKPPVITPKIAAAVYVGSSLPISFIANEDLAEDYEIYVIDSSGKRYDIELIHKGTYLVGHISPDVAGMRPGEATLYYAIKDIAYNEAIGSKSFLIKMPLQARLTKAHRKRRLRLQDVLVPITDDTIGLWHFDRTLWSTDSIKPSWNIARISEGKFGNGIIIQENTRNLTENIALYSSAHYGDRTTDSVVTEETPIGITQCRKIECISLGDTAFAIYSSPIEITSGQQYTLSFYAKGAMEYLQSIEEVYATSITWYDSDDVRISRTTLSQPVYLSRDTWKRVVLTGTAPEGAVTCRIYIGNNQVDFKNVGDYILIAGVQLEERNYPTPYVATSVSNEKLSYKIPPPSTVCCYFKLGSLEVRPELGDDRVLVWYAKVDEYGNHYNNVSSWKVFIPGGTKNIRFECINAQQSLTPKTIDITNNEVDIYDDKWHFMCVRFNGNNMQFMIDDVVKDISNDPWITPPVFETQKLGLGCDPEGFLRSANIYIDELRCDAIYVDDNEVEAWKASNRPFYDPYDYSVIEGTSIARHI